MALVCVKVDALIARVPAVAYLYDDLVSAGYVGLVKAVNTLPKGCIKMRALNAWIAQCLKREFGRVLVRERVIYIPQQSSDRRRSAGDPIPAPTVLHAIPETLETYSEQGAVDLEDVFAFCCRSDVDRECLRLRREGYKFREIAQRLKLPLQTAHRHFRQLEARIREHLQ